MMFLAKTRQIYYFLRHINDSNIKLTYKENSGIKIDMVSIFNPKILFPMLIYVNTIYILM